MDQLFFSQRFSQRICHLAKGFFGLVAFLLAFVIVAGCEHAAVAQTDQATESSVEPKPTQVLAVIPDIKKARWWSARHNAKQKEKDEMDSVDLLMVGDSITHGWENKGREVWNKYYAHRNPLNIGFSADRTENVVWRLQNGAVADISPKLAVIMIGTNNAGHRADKPVYTAAGIQMIIDELRLRLPETKLLLLAIFPRGATSDDKLRILNTQTNQIIAGFADDEHVFYLDVGDQFLNENGDLPKSVMPDRLHPNSKGYAIWAEAMEPKIKELLEE